MSVNNLIECIGLSPEELKRYLLAEIDEFLEAQDPADREEEFGDILFALLAMSWAHSGEHYSVKRESVEPKVKQRLRQYAALTRYPPRYMHDRIPELKIGVLHFAFSHFSGPWQEFDALRSGTVAEIHLLTEVPFDRPDRYTNHCVITFDDNDGIEYDIIEASHDIEGGNVVLCRVPNFMFVAAKKELRFAEFAELLSLQVLAALDGLDFVPGAIAHFHSWESGFLLDSPEFRSRMEAFKTIFSPYLTTGRLQSLVNGSDSVGWTMSRDELEVGAEYERKLCASSMRVVLESAGDRDFYRSWVHPDRLDVRSFARERSANFASVPDNGERHLAFIAGGRPVREKGWLELCHEFARVRTWAEGRGLTVSLAILCRERRKEKGAEYIALMEEALARLGLEDVVTIEPKVSLDQLARRIGESTAVIVPSLYDPFCLMPTYAVEAKTPAFVSCHAGVSENIKSREFTFDPNHEGDLARKITEWYESRPSFEYESCFPTYRDLYLAREAPQPWA